MKTHRSPSARSEIAGSAVFLALLALSVFLCLAL